VCVCVCEGEGVCLIT